MTTTPLLAAEKFWLGLSWVDWAVLVAYFVVVLAIGLWSLKRVKDMADFFMGGRRFGKIFMMFFAFGAGTSSEQAISVVAGTWRVGLAGIWWQFLWLWATPFYWIVAPVMRRMRALTTADFFEARYNTGTATLYSLYGMIMAIVFIAGGLYSSGKMINALTDGELEVVAANLDIQLPSAHWDQEANSFVFGVRQMEGYEFAILAMTVLFVTYGMAGGLGAAIITDFIQGVLTITFSFLLLPFVFDKIGGFGALHSQGDVKPGMFELVASADVARALGREPITAFYIVMLSVTALAGIVVQPHIMGVCGAGKTEFEGRFGFTVGNFLKRFCTVAWTFTGLACIAWYMGDASPLRTSDDPADQALYESLTMRTDPAFDELPGDEKDRIDAEDKAFADELFGRAAYDILPTIMPGLVGLLMASLLAAVMSTGDAQMVVGSGLFTENIYKRFLWRNGSARHYLWVGRIAGLMIVALALVLQSTFTDVIDALKVIIKTPAAIGISLWFGIVWRRWTTAAVWTSTLAAAAAWAFVAYFPDLLQKNLPMLDFMFYDGRMGDAWQMAFYLFTGVIVGIVTSLVTPRVSKEKLDHFFTLIHTPVKPGEEVPGPCTLPEDPAPKGEKLFNLEDIEIPKPTWVGMLGFIGAWICVGLIIWLTYYLAAHL
ncbi:MAG: sodium:solute symporter family protein [Planctomycetota bacterium]|nr:MAG: sodium:solute symporter family protein [Planctomycetota bacterium]